MIVVTGATGRLGRLVAEALLRRLPAARVALSCRDPSGAADLAARGARVRAGDFANPDTLAAAFEGAETVFLVSSNAARTGGDPLAQHNAAIAAARDAGARRVVYTSQMSAAPDSLFPPGRDHAATEAMLAASGLAWTALRHGFYAQSALDMQGPGLARGVIEAPADGPVAWTAHEDLAEADAAILAGAAAFDGPTPPLTGRETHDLADLARLASSITGRPVERRTITDAALAERVAGAPPAVRAVALGYYAAARAGEFVRTDPTLERLIGRPPVPMREAMAAALA